MLELLYTTLVLFGFFLPFFFFFPTFQPMKIFMILFQLILSIILLSKNFYKKHSLYKMPKFNPIHSLDFEPIKSLYLTYQENGTIKNISYDTLSNTEFSLIKTDQFKFKCSEKYYINIKDSCPITDIKLEKEKNNRYRNYIQINKKEILYYTTYVNLGKLYKSFNYSDFKRNKEDIFDINKLSRKEFHKLSNPILDFKFFIQFCDIFCFTSIFLSLCFAFFESVDILKINFFKILNLILQSIILYFNYVRFIKFIEIKKFLFENKDIYSDKNESYYPNSIFNIDSFPIALSLNIFIFKALFGVFPKKITFF